MVQIGVSMGQRFEYEILLNIPSCHLKFQDTPLYNFFTSISFITMDVGGNAMAKVKGRKKRFVI